MAANFNKILIEMHMLAHDSVVQKKLQTILQHLLCNDTRLQPVAVVRACERAISGMGLISYGRIH